MAMLRLFTALELPAPVRHALVEVQGQLQALQLPVDWVLPESLHVTLVFLGATDAGMLPAIGAALRGVAPAHRPFSLELSSVGSFPNQQHPRVIWAGVGGATDRLGALQAETAAAVVPLGFPREERRYHPHITLGYLGKHATAAQQTRLGAALQAAAPLPPLSWENGAITLFETRATTARSIYVARDTIALQ